MIRYRAGGPNLPRRTLDYLERGAPEGQRNQELFDAACQFRDAGVAQADAAPPLLARALADGLGESEAVHTIQSAFDQPPRQPPHSHAHGKAPSALPQSGAPGASVSAPTPLMPVTPVGLPEPIEDGFLKLLNACFRPEEMVSIAPAHETDEGAVAPGKGVTLTAAEWKSRVEAKGGIQRCFSTKLGLFLRVNPVTPGGCRNDDVTAFRHALVEFDTDHQQKPIPKEAQLGAIIASGLPVSALIDSGNKSLHAWVKVDAKEPKQYKERVEAIWNHFAGLHLDTKNKNPSRFSRCPEGRRTVEGEVRVQRLLALGLGAKAWDEWEAAQNTEALGSPMLISQLAAYDTQHDPNNVLGHRWLCRGSSLVIVGQSGVGKSSFCMQLMLLWALGLPAFAIKPVRPLRSLLIQAENDQGDLAEMYQGVKHGMGITMPQEQVLNERIWIYRDTTHAGSEFVDVAAGLIDRHRPDLVWCDPLLNYIGDEISEQKVISNFCCHHLNAISLRTGVVWCLLHHTGKPSRDPKAASHWTASDLAYSGLGSSALVNWSRETAVLTRVKSPDETPTFQLSMTKRRTRAGLRSIEGDPTDAIFLRHSTGGGICWEQCENPMPKALGRYFAAGRPSAFNYELFKSILAEHGGVLTRENVADVAAKLAVVERTVWRWWKRLNTKD